MPIFINNAVANVRKTPGIVTGVFADRPASAPDGLIFISTDTQEIFSYDLLTAAWLLIATNGGGGGTPDLQAVTTVGNITTNAIIQRNAGNTRSVFLSNDAIYNGGFIGFICVAGGECNVFYDNVGSNNTYKIPNKFGLADTFAMLSDIPDVESGTFTPTGTIVSNIADLITLPCQYLRVGTTVTMSGAFQMEAAAAFADCEFYIDLPVNNGLCADISAAGGSAICINSAFKSGVCYTQPATSDRIYIKVLTVDDVNLNDYSFSVTYKIN